MNVCMSWVLMNGARVTISRKSTTTAATIHRFTKQRFGFLNAIYNESVSLCAYNCLYVCARGCVCVCVCVRERACGSGQWQRVVIDRSPTRAGFHHDEVTLVSYLYLIVYQIIYPVIHSYSSCRGSCTRNCAYICVFFVFFLFLFSLICILRNLLFYYRNLLLLSISLFLSSLGKDIHNVIRVFHERNRRTVPKIDMRIKENSCGFLKSERVKAKVCSLNCYRTCFRPLFLVLFKPY